METENGFWTEFTELGKFIGRDLEQEKTGISGATDRY
jgi:hypothetical protein